MAEEVPFNPLTPSLPISYPLKTLEELESRSFFNSFHLPFNRSTVNLPPGKLLPNRQRVLVCHDMKGGYTDDDKWVQGGENSGAYGIWHWYLIDVFVYFSHTLVTLPPPCWTNAAHKHGVKVKRLEKPDDEVVGTPKSDIGNATIYILQWRFDVL